MNLMTRLAERAKAAPPRVVFPEGEDDTIIEAARQIAAGTAGGATEASIIGTLSGTVQTYVNLLALVLQAFFVSRIFKYIGVRGALFILPAIAATGRRPVMSKLLVTALAPR